MARAFELGFHLAKPVGNYESYDVAINLGRRFVRVQIKATWTAGRVGDIYYREGYYTIDLRRRSRKPYGRRDFDYLAVYIVPEDAWYIIPAAVTTRITGIRICPGNPRCKYEKYREAWELIGKRPKARAAKAGFPREGGENPGVKTTARLRRSEPGVGLQALSRLKFRGFAAGLKS